MVAKASIGCTGHFSSYMKNPSFVLMIVTSIMILCNCLRDFRVPRQGGPIAGCKGKTTDICCLILWRRYWYNFEFRGGLTENVDTSHPWFNPKVESQLYMLNVRAKTAMFKCRDTRPDSELSSTRGEVRVTTLYWQFQCKEVAQFIEILGPMRATNSTDIIKKATCATAYHILVRKGMIDCIRGRTASEEAELTALVSNPITKAATIVPFTSFDEITTSQYQKALSTPIKNFRSSELRFGAVSANVSYSVCTKATDRSDVELNLEAMVSSHNMLRFLPAIA